MSLIYYTESIPRAGHGRDVRTLGKRQFKDDALIMCMVTGRVVRSSAVTEKGGGKEGLQGVRKRLKALF